MSDVVALPALYEPFGNVHLEALASGIPVLTSARAGGAEAVAHRRSGWVVREPTAELVADGLSALRDMVGPDAAGRARESAEPFTYGRQADAFTGLYRQLRCA
jgi:UDP-glucose:(heptosyl)LPS alpha-1,3-glucosyltransferase